MSSCCTDMATEASISPLHPEQQEGQATAFRDPPWPAQYLLPRACTYSPASGDVDGWERSSWTLFQIVSRPSKVSKNLYITSFNPSDSKLIGSSVLPFTQPVLPLR